MSGSTFPSEKNINAGLICLMFYKQLLLFVSCYCKFNATGSSSGRSTFACINDHCMCAAHCCWHSIIEKKMLVTARPTYHTYCTFQALRCYTHIKLKAFQVFHAKRHSNTQEASILKCENIKDQQFTMRTAYFSEYLTPCSTYVGVSINHGFWDSAAEN